MGKFGAVALAELLAHDAPMLTELHLDASTSAIGDAGAVALAGKLVHVPKLTKLAARMMNRIGDLGATALADALQSNPLRELKELVLDWNTIGGDGVCNCQ